MLNQINDLIKRRWRSKSKYNIIAFLIARFCFLFFLSCCRSFNRLLFYFLMFWYNRVFNRSLHVFFFYTLLIVCSFFFWCFDMFLIARFMFSFLILVFLIFRFFHFSCFEYNRVFNRSLFDFFHFFNIIALLIARFFSLSYFEYNRAFNRSLAFFFSFHIADDF
jgi:hypothetical protein